jgi:DNA-binding NarL/FixJ family response regulator
VHDSDPIRIVLCDDVADIRELYRMALEAQPGFEVVGEAANGLDGVRLAAELHPDVVVLDLSMPDMDGLEAIPVIRRRAPGVGIIVLSGFSRIRMAGQVLEAGADCYIEKGEPLVRLRERAVAVAARYRNAA